jgi:hypothetical protein
VVVKATQTISGVTDSPQFQADFTKALYAVLPVGSTVTDLTVKTVARRQRRLLAGVVVSYTVAASSASGVSASALTSTLQSPATLSAVTTTLKESGYAGEALQAPVVITVSTGTGAGSTSDSGSSSNSGGSGGGDGNIGVIAGAVAGGVVLIGGIAALVLCLQMKKQAPGASRSRLLPNSAADTSRYDTTLTTC